MASWIDVGAVDSVSESNPLTTEVDGYPIVIVFNVRAQNGRLLVEQP